MNFIGAFQSFFKYKREPLCLLLTDVCSLFFSFLLACIIRLIWDTDFSIAPQAHLLYGTLFIPVLFLALGLYARIPFAPPQELKRIFTSVTLGFLLTTVVLFLTQKSADYSRFVFSLTWIFCIFFIPITRSIVRKKMAHLAWWGVEVLLFGNTKECLNLINLFKDHMDKGFKPVGMIAYDASEFSKDLTLPFFKNLEEAQPFIKQNPNVTALILTEDFDFSSGWSFIAQCSKLFNKSIFMPPSAMTGGSVWFSSLDVCGLPGLLVRQNLLDHKRLRMKRFIDLFLILLASPLLLLAFIIIVIAIRIDSSGAALYFHQRIGKNGKPINVAKFRSMVKNGDTLLAKYLEEHPEEKLEWETNQKLKNDPRVTKVGNFLRRTSLDELPQLWNVLKGEMSIVGPRPIIDKEVSKYSDVAELYKRVSPGITGLWQISGRSDTSYDERVALDKYYVCNWSIWLDIWIIAKTIPVVLLRKGAY